MVEFKKNMMIHSIHSITFKFFLLAVLHSSLDDPCADFCLSLQLFGFFLKLSVDHIRGVTSTDTRPVLKQAMDTDMEAGSVASEPGTDKVVLQPGPGMTTCEVKNCGAICSFRQKVSGPKFPYSCVIQTEKNESQKFTSHWHCRSFC